MTSEVTKRGLWFGFNGGGEPDGTYCTMKTGDPNEQFWVPYDTTLALVAEAYEDAADRMKEKAEIEAEYSPFNAACFDVAERSIRARTHADALAAREARDKRIREEALREAAEAIVKDGSRNTVYQKSRNDAVKIILALIEGDTDER